MYKKTVFTRAGTSIVSVDCFICNVMFVFFLFFGVSSQTFFPFPLSVIFAKLAHKCVEYNNRNNVKSKCCQLRQQGRTTDRPSDNNNNYNNSYYN